MIKGQDLPRIWPMVERIMKAKGKDTLLNVYDIHDLYTGILNGQIHLWAGINENGTLQAVMLVGVELHAYETNLHVMWVGGFNLKAYLVRGLERVEQYGKLAKVHNIYLRRMRPGIARMVAKLGYTPETNTVKKYVKVMEGVA